MTTYNVGFPGTVSVVVVAMRAPRESAGGGQGRPIFRRYTLNNDGTLTEATAVVDLNTHWCANTSRDCRPAGIALGSRGAGEAPAIFVVNRAFNPGASPQRWGFTVTKVNGNGVEQSGWSSHWRNYDPDGVADPSNWAAAVAVRTTGFGTPQSPYQDHVFVTAEVARRCGNGAVVARYNHAGDYFATRPTIESPPGSAGEAVDV